MALLSGTTFAFEIVQGAEPILNVVGPSETVVVRRRRKPDQYQPEPQQQEDQLTGGSLTYRVTRSRVHDGDTSLTVVNPFLGYEVPYAAVQRVGLSRSGSLMVLPKESAADTDGEGCLVVGFAGSLLDRIFKTSEKAAAELKKLHKKGPPTARRGRPGTTHAGGRCRRGRAAPGSRRMRGGLTDPGLTPSPETALPIHRGMDRDHTPPWSDRQRRRRQA